MLADTTLHKNNSSNNVTKKLITTINSREIRSRGRNDSGRNHGVESVMIKVMVNRP